MFYLIVAYLAATAVASAAGIAAILAGALPAWAAALRIGLLCCLVGGVGGTLYRIRAVYVNRGVHDRWSSDWYCWCFLRPFASIICSGANYLFLKAGLLVLDAGRKPGSSHIGYLAFAFIAGLNVDRFVSKIEDIAQTTWGIEESRSRQEVSKTSRCRPTSATYCSSNATWTGYST